MAVPLDSPQPVFTFPPLDTIPDAQEDQPVPGTALDKLGSLDVSALVFGAATLSHIYNAVDTLSTDILLRTVRLAMRYGIRSFDTSPYYGISEIVLGTALKALEAEFPRESYQLMTKCGRYGGADFDYSPATIRRSVQRSLERLHTSYLDAVYLHDTEFVAEWVGPRKEGDHSGALGSEAQAYGVAPGQEALIHGPGDQAILDAIAELRKMQNEGLVRNIGITGFPLPTLLRLSLLALHTAPYRPLDIVLSYSHLNLQNDTLRAFAPVLRERARVGMLLTASPLSMGLLTPRVPTWHPAPESLKKAAQEAVIRCADWNGGLPAVAIAWASKVAEQGPVPMPSVVGLSKLQEVHQAVRAWRVVRDGAKTEELDAIAVKATAAFEETGTKNWSWVTRG
ncbi:unnamed protein product [Peniophora sp. CBMAI 1063]|nr:unnamed protein product [Peniophora sp. CBMAI 1063]